jgi:hypothetical protein
MEVATMDILQVVNAQMNALGMPLYAVTLTAVPRADTPLLLMLHWHGFRREEVEGLPSRFAPLYAVPGSALQLNERWNRMEMLDEAMLEAGWKLGAWDVVRDARRGCNWIGASEQEALECRQAFGDYSPLGDQEDHLLVEAPDRLEMMHLAAAVGYVRWMFRPVKDSIWRQTAEDDTLDEVGGRNTPCPVNPITYTSKNLHVAYRLGRVERIILP